MDKQNEIFSKYFRCFAAICFPAKSKVDLARQRFFCPANPKEQPLPMKDKEKENLACFDLTGQQASSTRKPSQVPLPSSVRDGYSESAKLLGDRLRPGRTRRERVAPTHTST